MYLDKVKKFILLVAFLSVAACTTTKSIVLPPELGQRATIYDIYGVVLDTFQELTIPVEFQDPPYSLESVWMYWPPNTANKVMGFPLTWWQYRAIITDKKIVLEAEGRGLSLATLGIGVNFLPVPIDWVANAIRQNLQSLNLAKITVETRIVSQK